MTDKLAELRARRERSLEMGGPEGLRKYRESGRLPVLERIAMLVDAESWFEIGGLALPERRTDKHVPGDAVVTGFGLLDGRRVGVLGIDASVAAGATARQHAQAGPAHRTRPAPRVSAGAVVRR